MANLFVRHTLKALSMCRIRKSAVMDVLSHTMESTVAIPGRSFAASNVSRCACIDFIVSRGMPS